MNSHQFGVFIEELFQAECLKHGIKLLRPFKTSAHDFFTIVADKIVKIQVKGTRVLHPGKRGPTYRFRCFRHNAVVPHSYADAGIQLMAGYIVPLKRWHIFEAPKKMCKVYIARNPTGQHRDSINRWDLLGGKITQCKN